MLPGTLACPSSPVIAEAPLFVSPAATAWMLVPVIGIDLVADDGVAHLLNAVGWSSLIIRSGSWSIEYGGRKYSDSKPSFAANNRSVGIQLYLNLRGEISTDIRMVKGVVPIS